MKAKRRSRDTALFGVRWRWMVNATPRPLYPRERDPVPTGWMDPTAGLAGC